MLLQKSQLLCVKYTCKCKYIGNVIYAQYLTIFCGSPKNFKTGWNKNVISKV